MITNYIKEIVPKYVGKKVKIQQKTKVTMASDCIKSLQSIVKDENKEHFIALYLNGAHEIITYSIVSIGTLNFAQVHAREVFRPAILAGSASVIIAHNHPSGNVAPSADDRKVTNSLTDAGNILGIRVLDHIIFTNQNENYYSFQENNSVLG